MKVPSLLLALSAFLSQVSALGQSSPVVTESASGLLKLAGGGQNGQILVSADDWWGVLRAAQDLAGDFGKVTGKNLTLGNWSGNVTKRGLDLGRLEERDWNTPPMGKNPAVLAPSWEGKHRNPPKSGVHEVVDTKPAGTTVYYKFKPVTSFVNVSTSRDPGVESELEGDLADVMSIVYTRPRAELHRSNAPLIIQRKDRHNHRNNRQIIRHQRSRRIRQT